VAAAVATALLQAREIDFVPCSELFLDTLETFRSQGNAKLSFTDAAIITMARRGDGFVATFDSDFRGLSGSRWYRAEAPSRPVLDFVCLELVIEIEGESMANIWPHPNLTRSSTSLPSIRSPA
jgi:hypothetical protein